jgi:hypothetical protein
MLPITGVRYKCKICPDFDLCSACEAKNVHPVDHPLLKLKLEGESGCGRRWRQHGVGMGGMGRRVIMRGSCGRMVKRVQEALHIEVDGFFGPKTEEAVQKFQTENGLKVDGIVGPITMSKLFAHTPEQKAETPMAVHVRAPAPFDIPLGIPVGVAPTNGAARTENDMLVATGFTDVEKNLRLLQKHSNNVQAVIAEYLR